MLSRESPQDWAEKKVRRRNKETEEESKREIEEEGEEEVETYQKIKHVVFFFSFFVFSFSLLITIGNSSRQNFPLLINLNTNSVKKKLSSSSVYLLDCIDSLLLCDSSARRSIEQLECAIDIFGS